MARVSSSVARRQPGSLKKAIFKKKVEKKQQRFFRRQQPLNQSSFDLIVPVIVEEAKPPLSFTSSTDNTMRSVMSLTESITRSDETVSCQQSTDRFLAGLFSPSDYQKNVESNKSEEVSHNLGLLVSLSPIPEEKTNQLASDKDVVSFGNLFASEQEKKQPALPKTSDEVISFGRLFSETENETTQSLGPLFSLPETSEQEVVTFGNLFASEKEATSSDEKSENTENLGPLFSLPVTSEQEVVTFGNLFATSPASEQETSQPIGPLFSLPTTSEQEMVTFGNLFAEEQDNTSSDDCSSRSITPEEAAGLANLVATTPSDHSIDWKNLDYRLASDVESGHHVCAYPPTVRIYSELDLTTASSKFDETMSLGHLFSEASEHDVIQSFESVISFPTLSEQEVTPSGYPFSGQETSEPIVTFPDSSDESEGSYLLSQKDSLELSYLQKMPRLSSADELYSDLSEEMCIPEFVREKLNERSDHSLRIEEIVSNEIPKNPRHRLIKKKTKEVSSKDRVAALEEEVRLLRAEVEGLRRKQKNTTATTQTEEALPTSSVRSVRFESKSDTVLNAKKTAEESKRETRTL